MISHTKASLPTSIVLIATERTRQIDEKGYNLAHDHHHGITALSDAAACYAAEDTHDCNADNNVPLQWPFDSASWKPRSRKENLIRAGARILAALDMVLLQYAGATGMPPAAGMVAVPGMEESE